MTHHPQSTLTRGYWCECWAQTAATGQAPVLLASFDATTAAEAINWIRVALRTISPSLDAEATTKAETWLDTGHRTDARALSEGELCTVTISQADTHIEWTARSAMFLALAHRQNRELPPCALLFNQRSATS
ncbi:hypothetical protein DMH02_006555 [Streptomyces sp. WAC 00631]|uniref:hypothetical protein n=1 Tax=Streptomyces sp. WAC 00631 TaxID=2203201 RepID=UPI000F78C884|nr:hypothetical protein [Streptomyces sp. WAC 00631]MCC5032899.1 hypothetical protein [Streptomyces sp. WAC 00631]